MKEQSQGEGRDELNSFLPGPADASAADLASERDLLLVNAIKGLLEALDRCGGDPPDCPYCGPARAFALDLINPKPGLERRGNSEPELHLEA